jgi:hypothetical protein
MTDDLVAQLRSVQRNPVGGLCVRAADRIEKLVAALREIAEDAEDEFASAKDMGWIARKALEGKDE